MKLLIGPARPLPAHRAFVVQVSAEADIAQGYVAGRVEHVVSGQTTHFQTPEDLLGFMAQVLTGGSLPPSETQMRDRAYE